MKIPNLITLGRLGLTVAGLVLLALHPVAGPGSEPGAWWPSWVAFALLLVAAATDYVDGFVARALGQTSKMGRLLDPLVDKVLICGALVLLLDLPGAAEILPDWLVVIVVVREFVVTSVRGFVESQGESFGADRFGKWKMGMQCVLVLGLVALVAGWSWTRIVSEVFVWIVLVFTVLSGANYLRKASHVLRF